MSKPVNGYLFMVRGIISRPPRWVRYKGEQAMLMVLTVNRPVNLKTVLYHNPITVPIILSHGMLWVYGEDFHYLDYVKASGHHVVADKMVMMDVDRIELIQRGSEHVLEESVLWKEPN